jgi:hypothetical protein
MEVYVPEYERLPFPPGSAPFRIKGQAYRGHVAYTNDKVPGGMKAAVAAIRSAKIRDFFEQPFLAASFYDIFPLITMGYVCSRLVGTSFTDFLRARTRAQVELDVGSVFKFLLRIPNPATVATKIPSMVAQYFDFGTVDVQLRGTTVEATTSDIPTMMAPWYGPITETYGTRALELNGSTNVRGTFHPWKRTGVLHGTEVGSMRVEWSWGGS